MNKTLMRLYGNQLGHKMLESIVRKCYRYLGIGTGDNVYSSGEKGVVETVMSLYKAPFIIFDAGSHRGQYLYVAQHALEKADCQIHSFEPSARLFHELAKKAKIDPCVITNNFGLGTKTSQMELFFDKENTAGSLTRRKLNHFGITEWKSENVSITTVDEYCAQNN